MVRKQMLKGVFLFTLSVSLFSCTEGDSINDDIQIEDVDTVEIAMEADPFESPDLDYHLPSALQVASIFKKSGMKYTAGVTNSVDNVSSYTTDEQSKLNFGVYSADLAYCITNSQANDARKFITAIQTLAEQQGMAAIFQNKDLMERFDKNLEIQDSIEYIIVEIHERSQEYLEDNEMEHVAAVHYGGAWVEGMYLGFTDYKNNSDKVGVGMMLAEQMEILSNIIKGLKDSKNSDLDLAWIVNDLTSVENMFNEFASVKAFNSNPDSAELTLTPEEIKKLGNKVIEIRTKIVQK